MDGFRWLWMVGDSKGSRGEQNPAGGVTQNLQKSRRSKMEKLRFFKLWSPTLWLFSGYLDGGGIMAGLQALDWYLARPIRWPEIGDMSGSGSRFGSGSGQLLVAFSLSLSRVNMFPLFPASFFIFIYFPLTAFFFSFLHMLHLVPLKMGVMKILK